MYSAALQCKHSTIDLISLRIEAQAFGQVGGRAVDATWLTREIYIYMCVRAEAVAQNFPRLITIRKSNVMETGTPVFPCLPLPRAILPRTLPSLLFANFIRLSTPLLLSSSPGVNAGRAKFDPVSASYASRIRNDGNSQRN